MHYGPDVESYSVDTDSASFNNLQPLEISKRPSSSTVKQVTAEI